MLNKEIDQISDLINLNKDAAVFYSDAQDKVEDQKLKSIFQDLKQGHSNIVKNLSNYLQSRNENVDVEETYKGKLANIWGDIAAKFSSDVDHTLIKHLEEAEDRCLHQMQDIMNSDEISELTKAAITKEALALRKTHDYMKHLKDCADAA